MNTPQTSPTPYDILPIPSFPFIPSWRIWLVTISILLVGYLIIRFLNKRSTHFKIRKLSLVLEELEKFATKELDSNDAARLSLLVRRYLASESDTLGSSFLNMPALAGVELKSLLSSTENNEIKILLTGLLELEDSKFQQNKTQIKSAAAMQKALIQLSQNKKRNRNNK